MNPLRHMLAFAVAVLSLSMCAVGSTFAAIAWLPIRVVSGQRTWQKLVDWIIYKIFSIILPYLEKVAGFRIHFYGDRLPSYESALLIANHTSLTDWLLILHIAARKGRVGSCKYFAKEILKWVPGFGWGLWLHGSVLLKRDWLNDRESIEKTFSYLRSSNFPFWLINFLEGTRQTPKKLKQSQEFAQKGGLPVWKHVMVPRVKGFQASVMSLHDKVDAVYDLTFGCDERRGAPTMWEMAAGVSTPMHIDVVRFPIASIPQDPKALADWVMQRFARKEQLLEYLKKNGRFPSAEYEEPMNFLPQGFERPAVTTYPTQPLIKEAKL